MNLIQQKIAGEIVLAKNPGASMKKWREIFGITQTELAQHLDITPSTISDYESNRRSSPGIAVIKRFIQALMEIDEKKGGNVSSKFGKSKPEAFETHDFPEPVDARAFLERIGARVITNKRRIKDMNIVGYSLVDSLRAILELSAEDFSKIYGSSTNRAIIFDKVGIGRSPMVAIRVTEFKPSLVVYQGMDHMDDPIARKISEVEKIPIALTSMDNERIVERLSRFETPL
ncbi:MAG: helix-turn-helix domain-containing protein [Candidatus Diapherotrites archaeon]|nr:helix-turn-helix domain-containing protein [Candidatus Diapherotrites archaeon]